ESHERRGRRVLAFWKGSAPRAERLVHRTSVSIEPKLPAVAVDDVAHRLDAALVERQHFVRVGQSPDETQPFLPIVIAVAVEVLADEDTQLCLQTRGGQNGRQEKHRGNEIAGLNRNSPHAAAFADDESANRHADQVQTDADERRKIENELPR